MEKQQNSKNSNINVKNVEKKFGIYNNPLIGENKQFLQEIMDKIPGIIKIGYQSLRKISKYFDNIPWNQNISSNNQELV